MNADSQQPITRQDLDEAVGELATITNSAFQKVEERMDGLEERMGGLEGRMGSLERGQQAILDVVQSIDQQLRPLKDLNERVERIERHVFG